MTDRFYDDVEQAALSGVLESALEDAFPEAVLANPWPPAAREFYENPWPGGDGLFFRNRWPEDDGLFFENRSVRKVLPVVLGLAAAGTAITALVMLVRGRLGGGPRAYPGPGRTAVVGDSISAHSNGYVVFLDHELPDRSFTNLAVVGQGTAAILSDLRNQVIGRGYDEVIIQGGGNDLWRDNAVDYTTGNLRTMVQEAKAAGLKVVLLTMTPHYNGKDKTRAINQTILRDGRSWGADAVVNVFQVLTDANEELRSDLGSPDRIHPTRAGQLAMGREIEATAYVR